MLFNSYIFVFLFLPLTLIGYYILNHTKNYSMANIFLIGMSLWFYGYYNPSYLAVICTSVLANYTLTQMMDKLESESVRKFILGIGIFGNAVSIFYFKYYDFFVDNINSVLNTSFQLRHIVLPLGISFFTFQQMSYLVDSYRGQTKGYGFIEYALFVVYFPQLIAGPIVLHNEVIPQFRDENRRSVNSENMAKGIYIFALGLAKKVLIADTFGRAVSWGFGTVSSLSSMEAILVSISYTLQLFFDFSGYCDMAIGIGYMFNIQLPQNFNSPHKATSILDFWSRWHMSLTRFLRQYVYFPLGGSKKGTIRTYINIIIVFLVSGIWHGANWTYIVWGLLHGILNCLNRMFEKQWSKVHVVVQWMATFTTVSGLLVIFRSNTMAEAIAFLKKIIWLGDFSIRNELKQCFALYELQLIDVGNVFTSRIDGFYMWGILLLGFLLILNAPNSNEIVFKPTKKRGVFTVLLLFWSIVSLAGVSEFLYFGF
ncbi:MAG: MBOAT family protein [Roseburia sp.]|nr:MBOAT family protein [Roseburia sp.]